MWLTLRSAQYMKIVLKFPNPEAQAKVLSQAPTSKTQNCVIVTNWLLCCTAGGGRLCASSTGWGGGVLPPAGPMARGVRRGTLSCLAQLAAPSGLSPADPEQSQ